MPIYFLFHKYWLNHGLIRFLSNWMEWVDSIWCDLYKRESNRDIFYSNLESSWCDSNLQNFCAQIFQLRNYFHAQHSCTRFSLSLLIVPCHSKPLMTKPNQSQFLILVLAICSSGLLIVINGLVPIFSSAFRPKSTLIVLPLFWLPKVNYCSPCIRISM